MNSMGMRPAPAPCKEPDPLAFRPRDVARARSTIVLVEPVSRTKDSARDPLRLTGTKTILLRQSKPKVDSLLPAAKVTLAFSSDACAHNAPGTVESAIANSPSLKRRQLVVSMRFSWIHLIVRLSKKGKCEQRLESKPNPRLGLDGRPTGSYPE